MEKHFFLLPDDDLVRFASCLKENKYEIELTLPNRTNCPDGVVMPFTEHQTYQQIFDSADSTFSYFSLRYASCHQDISIPLGVFGICNSKRLYFPLLISSVGREFLMMPFAQFSDLLKNTGVTSVDEAYKHVIGIRSRFMTKIFRFYQSLDKEYNPVMSWASRGEVSPTRRVAEGLGFIRKELTDSDGCKEFYFGKKFDMQTYEFIVSCSQRWSSIFKDRERDIASDSRKDLPENLMVEKLQRFYLPLASIAPT